MTPGKVKKKNVAAAKRAFTVHPYPAAQLFHNPPDNGQAQAVTGRPHLIELSRQSKREVLVTWACFL